MSDDVSDDNLALGLSIDLEAELVSITERQHLNKVHWAVQLVRHALERRPLRIDVRVTPRMLELRHDGDGISPDEHRLLLAVTRGPDEGKQAALAELESRFGVTLLSLLMTSSRMELVGRLSLSSQNGRVSAGPPSPMPGYRLRVYRAGGALPRYVREEKSELRFYCRSCDVPMTLNGRPLNTPLALERAILKRPFRSDDGAGLIGLPTKGGLTRLRYYKRGVYFGVRQSLPSDARPVEACFDANLFVHEDNFERSVEAANQGLRVARRELYRDLPALFPQMTPRERARVKDIALGLSASRLPSPVRRLPLFDTSASSWRLSLDDIEELSKRFGQVRYLPRPSGRDDELPVLRAVEVAAVSRLLAVPVRRALQFRPRERVLDVVTRSLRALLRASDPEPTPARALSPDALDEGTRALLDALARDRVDVRFFVTDGGAPVLRSGRVRRMYLPLTDPALRRAVLRYRERPSELDAIGASLLTAA